MEIATSGARLQMQTLQNLVYFGKNFYFRYFMLSKAYLPWEVSSGYCAGRVFQGGFKAP
jgi:hypothetical protein